MKSENPNECCSEGASVIKSWERFDVDDRSFGSLFRYALAGSQPVPLRTEGQHNNCWVDLHQGDHRQKSEACPNRDVGVASDSLRVSKPMTKSTEKVLDNEWRIL